MFQFIRKRFSSPDIGTDITYTFQSPDGFIELDIDERSVNGWSAHPHKYPTRVSSIHNFKSDFV